MMLQFLLQGIRASRMGHIKSVLIGIGQCRWLALTVLFMTSCASAWASNPDAAAAAIIVADVLVAGKTVLSPPPAEPPPSLVAVSAGGFDIGQHQQVDLTSVFGAEYRFGGQHFWNSQPVIGLAVTPHETVYGYGGLRFNVSLPHEWEIASTFGLAGYSRGNGKDLGSAKEAYFELSVGRRFADNTRIELAARHLSHDDLFSSYNPGVDILAISVAFPIK
jgi:hypothetical protein